jgi:hypothetical protein
MSQPLLKTTNKNYLKGELWTAFFIKFKKYILSKVLFKARILKKFGKNYNQCKINKSLSIAIK